MQARLSKIDTDHRQLIMHLQADHSPVLGWRGDNPP